MHRPREFGPYQLLKRIAGGGMAEIFLARTHGVAGFEKFLALKMIRENFSDDEEFVEMLINEAKIAVRLHHQNIVQVFDLGRIEGVYYIAMEYIDGRDLQALLVETARQDVYVPWEAAAFMVREACAGLHYAHTRLDEKGAPLSIVHRDVSPQNVLLGFDGQVKLADFGIAKANIARSETQVGVIKGKFSYMSPEQAWGDKLDNRSDVFSIGVVLYELLTGEMLYQEEDQLRLLDKVRRAQIPPPTMIRRDIPSDLEAITMMALERDRKDRFMSCAALQLELTRYLAKSAPHYGGNDLQGYLHTIFGNAAEEFEREVRALDPNQGTRASIESMPQARRLSPGESIETAERSQRVMKRDDFVPNEGSSLVYDVRKLTAESPNATSRPQAPSHEDSTRPIRFTAPPEDPPAAEVDEGAPTRAHSRAEIDAILAGNDPRLQQLLSPGGGVDADEDDDPTMLYGADAVRAAVEGNFDGSSMAPLTREQLSAELTRQVAALAGPEQAADGSWDPRSEAILLASSDLEVIASEDPVAVSPGAGMSSRHPLEHAALAQQQLQAQAPRGPSAGGFGGGGYRPQASLLPAEAVAQYHHGAVNAALEHAQTRPVQSSDAIRRAQRHGYPGFEGSSTMPGTQTGSSYSGLWVLAVGLLLLGILAVLVVLIAG